MHILENFLTSNHHFTHHENLIKFRFSLLNSILIIAIFFTLLNYFASLFHFIKLIPLYENILLAYAFINMILIYLLRYNKALFYILVHTLIIVSLVVFSFTLFTIPKDTFRLIWFFLVLFASFVIMGKKYGITLMVVILSFVFLSNIYVNLDYSNQSLFTFFNSFLIFTAFSYFFLRKIEKDEEEFILLNNQLKKKVSQEVQQRKEQEQMLLQQCRLASMGEMIDSIAHQWRQPLMNINAILMNMDRAIETQEKSKEYLEYKMTEVINLTEHMSQTIEDFRSLFKEDKTKTHFSIDSSMYYTFTLLKSVLKDIEIAYVSQRDIELYTYKNEFIQTIIILLSNATEILQARHIDPKKITIKTNKGEKHIQIQIEDNAGGIPQEFLALIFDPYFTTKEKIGGTGLGLYVAKIIIEQNMQGSLHVQNTHQGAKFEISIPL